MSIIQHDDWGLSERGKKDAQRHQEKIDDAIRKSVKDVIAEESIITSKRGRKVKIPIKGLKDYMFKHGSNGPGGGVGQGDGKPGDVIGRKPKEGQGEGGQAGDQKGEDYLEAEVDIDYLIKILFEDLGLPWLEDKEKAKQIVPKGWKFESISKVGIVPRIHKKRTMLEAIKRTATYIREVIDDTGCDYDVARKALVQSDGDIDKAIELVKDDKVDESIDGIFIEDDDLRYKQIEQDTELHSNAVVIAMMDVSGSMSSEKKYLARSMLFWMVEFLKKVYSNVEIRFIKHTTEAQLVSEDEFFKTKESGGTKCASAFHLANHLIDTEYPVSEWNVYSMYLSDGDDFQPTETLKEINIMLEKNINMIGYTEITPGSTYGGTLMKHIRGKWAFTVRSLDGTNFFTNKEKRFLLAKIKKKEHIWEALKHFMFKEER